MTRPRPDPIVALSAVIFDMDGVLIDSEPIHYEATRALMADHGIDYSPRDNDNFCGRTDRDVFSALRATYGLRADNAELAADWIARVLALLSRPLTPMAGVPEVLIGLRRSGIRLALASSSAPAIISATIDGLGLSALFELMVSGHDVESGKPAPDIFLEAVRRLGVRPEACLVIEDSYNGLCAALAAGLTCVAVPCRSTAAQDFSGAAVRLASLEELPAWLQTSGRDR